MGFLTKPDSIGALTYSSGVITLQPSRLTIGGQQYITSVLSYTVTGLSASTLYNLFVVVVGTTVSLVPSTNSVIIGPAGYTNFVFLRSFLTNGSSAFGSFAGASTDPFPVGTIIDSLLTEAQFVALMWSSWILMDSRSISSSMCANLTGLSSMIDSRGQFRRTKNNGRADGSQDPGGERAIGSLQGQATARNGLSISDPGHTHPISYWSPSGGAYGLGGGASSTQSGTGPNTTGISLGAGDAETRPRNIAVNTFVKINMG